MRAEREIHVLASFVHGALATLHGIGIFYNLRRKNWLDAGIHATAAIYSLKAVKNHLEAEPER